MNNSHYISLILLLLVLIAKHGYAQSSTRVVGYKNFEVSNHLNNVSEVTTDRKLAVATTSMIAYNDTDILSNTDYYPYGMQQVDRSQSDDYKYGFQGQEMDDAIKGKGNSVNYKYRMHDPRVGRFFAVDPLYNKYPYNSQYAFSENNVINAIELEGLEKYVRIEYKIGSRIVAVEYTKVENDNIRNYFKTINITNTTNNFRQLKGILDNSPNPDYQSDLGGGGNGWIISKRKNVDSTGFYSKRGIDLNKKAGRLVNAFIKDSVNSSVKSYSSETSSNGSHLIASSLLAQIRFQRDIFALPLADLQNNEYLNEILNYAQTLENLNNPNLTYTIDITGMASQINKTTQGGNAQLSINRANFIRQYFINNGIPANRLNATGVSTSRNTGNNANDRRVEVKLNLNIRSQ